MISTVIIFMRSFFALCTAAPRLMGNCFRPDRRSDIYIWQNSGARERSLHRLLQCCGRTEFCPELILHQRFPFSGAFGSRNSLEHGVDLFFPLFGSDLGLEDQDHLRRERFHALFHHDLFHLPV